MNAIIEFIKSSHVAIENRPQPYGLFHILFVVISLAIMITVCILLRKCKDKTFRIIMLSIGSVLLISEFYKQLYYTFADIGREGYDWYIFPFQLCSVPMYLCFAIGFMKKSKVRDAICIYLSTIGFLGGIMAYAEPSGILNPYYFTLIHSCIWHALLIFVGLFIILTNNASNKIIDYLKGLIVFAGVVLVATTLNIIFKDKPSFNMCYISPFFKTPLAVFSSFDDILMNALGKYFGRIISILIYLFAVSLGGMAIYSLTYLIQKAISKINIKGSF